MTATRKNPHGLSAGLRKLLGWAQGRFEMNFPRRFTRWMRLLRCLPDAWYFSAVRRFTRA